jgi:hypothetical protein
VRSSWLQIPYPYNSAQGAKKGEVKMETALGKIHNELEEDNITFRFKKIGSGKNEWQILGYLGHIPIKGLFDILRFNVINPLTQVVQEHVIVHSKPTAIMVVVINGEYTILTQQHRPIFGRWFKELIRGWIQDENDILEPLRRKLPQLLKIGSLSAKEPVRVLHSSPEDTGLKSNNKTIVVINVDSNEPVTSAEDLQKRLRIGNTGLCKPFVHTVAELDHQLYKLIAKPGKKNLGLLDCQSIGVWATFYFFRNPPSTIS